MSQPTLHPIARFPEEWATRLAAEGQRPFAAKQVFGWIHRHGVLEPAKMTNVAAALRRSLEDEGLRPEAAGVAERAHRSSDGTRKVLVRLADGATVETVLIPGVTGPRPRDTGSGAPEAQGEGAAWSPELDADAAAAEDDLGEDDAEAERGGSALAGGEAGQAAVRVTQCISTQVGCAMGCVFCASGVAGLKRNLAPEEIVGQVLTGRAMLAPGEQLRNVVLMGMGEPLHNYEATARALRLLTHPEGVALSTRRVTVSTSGLVPEILRLGRDFAGQIGLSVSLHATDDESRSALMPINRRYPLAELTAALAAYPLPRRRRITVEYTLVAGWNDGDEHARRLAKLLRGLRVKVNLIPMNPIEASPLGPPEQARVESFQRALTGAGYTCFVRRRRGDDVSAACGQLALLGAKPKVRSVRSPAT